MCLVCLLHKLIILSKFVTEKETRKTTTTTKTLHLHYSKIIVFVVLLSFCVILIRVRMTQWESECVNDKLVKFQLMHYQLMHIVPPDYTFRLPKLHLCIFGGKQVCKTRSMNMNLLCVWILWVGKLSNAWLYGVHRTCSETTAVFIWDQPRNN